MTKFLCSALFACAAAFPALAATDVPAPALTKREAVRVAKEIFREECVETWPCAMVADGPVEGYTYVWITIFPDEQAVWEIDAPMAHACVVFNRAGRVVEKNYALCRRRAYI